MNMIFSDYEFRFDFKKNSYLYLEGDAVSIVVKNPERLSRQAMRIYSTVLQFVADRRPETRALVLAYLHTQYFFAPVHIDAQNRV